MGNERRQKLIRQRQILIEHLDWINQEIDRETIQTKDSHTPKTSRLLETIEPNRPVAATLETPSRSSSQSQSQVAAELYNELGPDTKSAAAETKRGCLIIGAVSFISLLAFLAYVFFWYK